MTLFDTTSPDKTEETLRLHSRILELSHDAIIIWRFDGGIVFWNRGAEARYGYTKGEAIGRTTHDLLQTQHPESLEAVVKAIEEAGQWEGELEHTAKDGSKVRVSSRHQLVKDFDGGMLVLEINRDITESLRIQAELLEAREAAEFANRAKSAFLANMSHELRSPLSAILGFADILMAEVTDEANRDRVATIRTNGAFLLELLNDILDLSKIEAGKLAIKPEPVEVIKLMADVVTLMRVRTEAKDLSLRFSLGSSVPKVISIDGRRLRQVLVNLLGNAIKFTDQGEVSLKASVLNAAGSDRLVIEVKDTGTGIDQADLQKIFRPFEQAEGRPKGLAGGTGLGLSISRLLTRELGGRIDVESQLGVGSRFTVTLPIVEPSAELIHPQDVDHLAKQSSSVTVRDHGDRLDGRRIVVVDDRRDIRHVAAYFLERVGAEVLLAENGQEALNVVRAQQADNQPVDLVLMDMQMPTLDGYEATKRLVESGFTQPIIALTAAAMKGERERCLEAGCSDYLTKPIDGFSLVEVCVHALAKIAV